MVIWTLMIWNGKNLHVFVSRAACQSHPPHHPLHSRLLPNVMPPSSLPLPRLSSQSFHDPSELLLADLLSSLSSWCCCTSCPACMHNTGLNDVVFLHNPHDHPYVTIAVVMMGPNFSSDCSHLSACASWVLRPRPCLGPGIFTGVDGRRKATLRACYAIKG